jgi:hypothetical protein
MYVCMYVCMCVCVCGMRIFKELVSVLVGIQATVLARWWNGGVGGGGGLQVTLSSLEPSCVPSQMGPKCCQYNL